MNPQPGNSQHQDPHTRNPLLRARTRSYVEDWSNLIPNEEVVIEREWRLLQNFKLPLVPSEDFAVYYEYEENVSTSKQLPYKEDRCIRLKRSQDDQIKIDAKIPSEIAEAIASGPQRVAALQVAEFANCQHVEDFLRAEPFGRYNLKVNENPNHPMKPEVIVKARKESSLLFIKLPYLSRQGKYVDDQPHSLKLSDYPAPKNKTVPVPGDLWAHQAWFVVVKNHAILAAKSAGDDDEAVRPILVPRQHRKGALHALMHMISDLVQSSEKALLEEFSDIVSRYEFQSLDAADGTKLAQHILKMRIARKVLDDQMQGLNALKDILKHSMSFNWRSSTDDERYNTNMINIPVISEQNPEQIPYALKKLTEVLEERRNIHRMVSQSIDTLLNMGKQNQTETLQKSFEASNSALEASNLAMKDAIKEQIRYAEALNDEVSYQGRTISAFTALNVLFLPLGFFSQFFGLDALDKYSKSQAKFWTVTAPITGLIMVITLYCVIISQYEFRKIMRFIGRLFWQWRIDRPLNRADAHAQEQFRQRLPLYQIKIEAHEESGSDSSTAGIASIYSTNTTGLPNLPDIVHTASAANAATVTGNAATPAPGASVSNVLQTSGNPTPAQTSQSRTRSSGHLAGGTGSLGSLAPLLQQNNPSQPPGAPQSTITPSPLVSQYLLSPKISELVSHTPAKFGPVGEGYDTLPGQFRFDKSSGYLFLDYIDKHDNMYYAYITPSFPASTGTTSRSIVWRKIQLPSEREPLFFRGVFKKEGNELFGLLSGKRQFTLWYNDLQDHNTVPRFKRCYKLARERLLRTSESGAHGSATPSIAPPPPPSPLQQQQTQSPPPLTTSHQVEPPSPRTVPPPSPILQTTPSLAASQLPPATASTAVPATASIVPIAQTTTGINPSIGPSNRRKVDKSRNFFAYKHRPNGQKELGLLGLDEDKASTECYRLKLERVAIEEQRARVEHVIQREKD